MKFATRTKSRGNTSRSTHAVRPGAIHSVLDLPNVNLRADNVLEGLKREGGTGLKTSLDHTKEEALKAALAGVQAAVPAAAA